MTDFVPPLRNYEFGNPAGDESYFRVEYGYLVNQYYLTGTFNSFFYHILLEQKGAQSEVVKILSGKDTVISFTEGQLLKLSEQIAWVSNLIPSKNKKTSRVITQYLRGIYG